MSLEKFPIIGQGHAIHQGGLPVKTSIQLKECSKKVSGVADQLIARLGELEDETLTPDEIDEELFQISKEIKDLKGRALRAVLKPFRNAVFNTVFPINGDLNERN